MGKGAALKLVMMLAIIKNRRFRFYSIAFLLVVLLLGCSKKDSFQGNDTINGKVVRNELTGAVFIGFEGYYRHLSPSAFSALLDEVDAPNFWISVKEDPGPIGKVLYNAGLTRNSSVANSPVYYVEAMNIANGAYFYCREVQPAIFKKYHFSEQKIQSHSFTFSDNLENGAWIKGTPLLK